MTSVGKTGCALLLAFLPVLAGCHCNAPLKITPMLNSDKEIGESRQSCPQLEKEMEEAEYYRENAKNAIPTMMSKILMPTCMTVGTAEAKNAVETADARISYLQSIYDLMNCDKGGSSAAASPLPLQPQPAVLRQPAVQAPPPPPVRDETQPLNIVDPMATAELPPEGYSSPFGVGGPGYSQPGEDFYYRRYYP
jgi:hypothetical protein